MIVVTAVGEKELAMAQSHLTSTPGHPCHHHMPMCPGVSTLFVVN